MAIQHLRLVDALVDDTDEVDKCTIDDVHPFDLPGHRSSQDRRWETRGTARQVSMDGPLGMRPAKATHQNQSLLRRHAHRSRARLERCALQPPARGMRSRQRHGGLQVRNPEPKQTKRTQNAQVMTKQHQ